MIITIIIMKGEVIPTKLLREVLAQALHPVHLLPLHHPWCHERPRGGGFCADRHWSRPHPDPPHLDPCYQHLGQSGSLDRAGAFRRRLGAAAAMAFLACSDHRGSNRRHCLEDCRRRRLIARKSRRQSDVKRPRATVRGLSVL